MTEPWIRVHANLADKPVVSRAAAALGVSIHEAMGLLVQFWGRASQHATDGRVSHHPDELLERWADWRGEPGRFARFVRDVHTDVQGRINEWDEYHGALEDRREYDRERKRLKREEEKRKRAQSQVNEPVQPDVPPPSDGRPTDSPLEVHRTSTPTIRNDTSSTTTSSSSADALASLLTTDEDRDAMNAVLMRAPGRAAGIHALLLGLLNGIESPQPTPVEMGRALRDYTANETGWNAAHFRAYLRRAIQAERSPPDLRVSGASSPYDTPEVRAMVAADKAKRTSPAA